MGQGEHQEKTMTVTNVYPLNKTGNHTDKSEQINTLKIWQGTEDVEDVKVPSHKLLMSYKEEKSILGEEAWQTPP